MLILPEILEKNFVEFNNSKSAFKLGFWYENFSPEIEVCLITRFMGNLIKNKVSVTDIIKARKYPIIKISPGIERDSNFIWQGW